MENEKIDLRSDTITQPTKEMRKAMMECEVGDDVSREDPTINRFEERTAEIFGKEAALFVPSGTFGNQCSIMTHTQSGNEIIVCDDSHIVQHEAGASALLSRVQLRTITPQNNAYMTLAEIESKLRKDKDIHYPTTGLICLEQATAYGNVYPQDLMRQIWEMAQYYGVPIHIDGARIFNAALALGTEPKELTKYCDSISICLSKGLCAPVGSVIAGDAEFIEKARVNRKILGGGMRQAGFLAACGMVAYEKMTDRLAEDHENAKLFAHLIDEDDRIEISRKPEISMVFVKLKNTEQTAEDLVEKITKKGLLTYLPEAGEIRFVMRYGITEKDVKKAAAILLGELQ